MAAFVVVSVACVQIPSPVERKSLADDLAAQHAWVGQVIESEGYFLQTYRRKLSFASEHLVVYLEGDGLAWYSSTNPSSDPTPVDPVAFKMAMAHPGQQAAAYVARPCQYAWTQRCQTSDWTDGRFSKPIINSTDQVIDALKRSSGATRLILVGYSGGAAVAALVASQRQDVDALVTVAGNLDTSAWVRHHQISPLVGSMNPLDQASKLKGMVQVHFLGANDGVIPASLVKNFTQSAADSRLIQVSTQTDFDHACCWAQNWPSLWREVEDHLVKMKTFSLLQ
jgi:pimeloyl-ACP methyl ester carboxylesterase